MRLLVLPCALVLLSACNAPGPREPDAPRLPYLAARGADLLDILEVNLSAGTGLLVAAGIEPVRVGYGWASADRIGTMGRAVGIWKEERSELFVGLQHLLAWRKEPRVGNGFLFTPDALPRENAHPHIDAPGMHPPFFEQWGWTTRLQDHERPWLDVAVEAHLFFVGFEAAFSPQELFDFVFGLFGIDSISHDDRAPVPVTESETEHDRDAAGSS